MAAVTICSDSGAPENKVCNHFHCFPIYLLWSDRTGWHDFSFLNVEFEANFFISTANSKAFSKFSGFRRCLSCLPPSLTRTLVSTGPTWVIQVNLTPRSADSNLNPPALPSLSYEIHDINITYSSTLGFRRQTSLGDHYSAYHTYKRL